jgi:hypothetical protein
VAINNGEGEGGGVCRPIMGEGGGYVWSILGEGVVFSPHLYPSLSPGNEMESSTNTQINYQKVWLAPPVQASGLQHRCRHPSFSSKL